jgi:hypothetical protein
VQVRGDKNPTNLLLFITAVAAKGLDLIRQHQIFGQHACFEFNLFVLIQIFTKPEKVR